MYTLSLTRLRLAEHKRYSLRRAMLHVPSFTHREQLERPQHLRKWRIMMQLIVNSSVSEFTSGAPARLFADDRQYPHSERQIFKGIKPYGAE